MGIVRMTTADIVPNMNDIPAPVSSMPGSSCVKFASSVQLRQLQVSHYHQRYASANEQAAVDPVVEAPGDRGKDKHNQEARELHEPESSTVSPGVAAKRAAG